MERALIVIDVQNYFAVERAAGLPEKIAGFLSDAPHAHVLFTKFRNDPDSNFHRQLEFTDVTGSPATDLHAALEPFTREDNVFEKTTYSAFKAPGLRDYLDARGVTAVDLCGISYDACVLASTFDAFDLGYTVTVLENLTSVSSVRDDIEDAAKLIMNRNLRPRVIRIPRD